jgi:glycosyltransferase involved in cell wall biosynthesis
MNNPMFSVVIPTYNRAELLKRTLRSLVAQTYKNFEVIVCDDGSTDHTNEVVESFRKDLNIKYIWEENWGGPARPRNNGIRAASSEWIAFLDSDDWWIPNKLKLCVEHITDDVDLIYHNLRIKRNKPALFQPKTIKSRQVKAPVLVDLLVNGNTINNSSVVVRRSILVNICGINENPNMIAAEDYSTWLKIASITDKFYLIPKYLGYYMLHPDGISHIDMSIQTIIACEPYLHILNKNQLFKFDANLKYLKGRAAFLSNDINTSKNNLYFSLKHGKFMIKLKSIWMLLCRH